MEHWSTYWQTSGVLNSFAEGNVKYGYSGELKAFWEAQFKAAPNAAKVVDIGTGNGALAILAYDFSRAEQKDFVVEGLDAATIQPAKQFEQQPLIAKKLKAIQFHSATPAEQLPHADSSVDLFVSQFGFEYSDRSASLAKMLSALKPAGRIVMVCHHAQSALTKQSKLAVEVLNYCLRQSPLFQLADMYFDLARQGIPQIGLDGWANYPHQKILTQSLQWTMDVLKERFKQADAQPFVTDVIARVARLLQSMQADNQPALIKALGLEYRLLNDHYLRVQDQLAASLAKKDISALEKQAQQLGAKFQAEPLTIDGQLFGWQITIQR